MNRLLSVINRYLPLLFFIVFGITVIRAIQKFWSKHSGNLGTWENDFTAWLHTWWWVILFIALVLVLLVYLALLAHAGRLPKWIQKRRWLMDILDRLTNRQALEEMMTEQTKATFIDAEAIAALLKAKVIGQDLICDDLSAQIRRRLALQKRGKPVGVFLFAGYPGTGKTYLAKCLAEALQRKLLHFDMTQLSHGAAASMLFGSPKGYVGSDNYGRLTSGLRESPDALVLLDEIEKAGSEVHKKFLTAWNDGFVTEASDGRQISTTRSIFILTTNAAIDSLEDIRQQYANEPDEMRRAATNVLKDAGFAPEVLNRIDRIFVFSRLSGLDIARVTLLEIERMIQGYGLAVADQGIDAEILHRLMQRQTKLADYASTRDLVRAIEESIADSLIAAKEQGAECVMLKDGGDRVLAQPVPCPE